MKTNNKNTIKRIIILLMVLVLILTTLTLSQSTPEQLLYLSIEKPFYEAGEKITLIIAADNIDNYELSLSTENNYYKFSGELDSSIDFYPKEQGLHTAELTDKATNTVADALEFNVGSETTEEKTSEPQTESETTEPTQIAQSTTETTGIITTDKEQYAPGETVTAVVDIIDYENYKLYYRYQESVQRYIGDFREISFVPQGTGTHYIVLTDKENKEIEIHGFEVIEPGQATEIIEEPEPIFDELVDEEVELFDQAYEYSNEILELINSKGIIEGANINFYDKLQNKINISDETADLTKAELVEIFLEKELFKKLVLRELLINQSQNLSLGVDEVPLTNVLIEEKHIVKAFALDPTGLNFTNGTLTGAATGTELWKCKDWDFLTQTCLGTWQKIMDLIPGQEYNLTITADDPGFAETKINIINIQSYPTVWGNWTVKFNTTGKANLTITAINGTTWSNYSETGFDLKFLEVRCGNNIQIYEWINNSVLIQDYECNETGFEISKVLTSGEHILEFRFGDDTAYAKNYATIDVPTSVRDGAYPNGQNYEFYSMWTIPGSGNVTVVGLRFYDSETDLGVGEQIELALYLENGSRVSERVNITGTGNQEWLNSTLFSTPITVELGKNYTVGVGPLGGASYALGRDGSSNNPNYPPNGVGSWYELDAGGLNDEVPTGSQSNNKYTIWGILYEASIAPNVTALNNPGNNTNETSSSLIDFNFTVTDDTGFTNCTLYTNHTGSWAPNKTITSITNNSENNITVDMADGNILWNIRCWDNSSLPLDDWYTYNYTVFIDVRGPVTTIDNPDNRTNITTDTYELNASVTDATGIDTVTFMYRQNTSDTWHFACDDDRDPTWDCDWNLSTLPDGSTYEIRAYANDTWGNIGDNDTRYNITVDRTAPTITLNKPSSFGTISGSTYTVNATATDTGSGVSIVLFEYRENASESWKNICNDTSPDGDDYICSWNLSGLSEQDTYEVRATANDTLDNSNSDTNINISFARAPDILNMSASPEKTGIGQRVTISANITDSDGVDTAWVIITKPDNVNITGYMTNVTGSIYQYNYTSFTTGTFKYTIKANDTLGNENMVDPYFYIYADATVHMLAENNTFIQSQDVELIPGYTNWSSDQESTVQQIKAQGPTTETFNASGHSFISDGQGFSGSDGAYNDTWDDDDTDYIALIRGNGGGWGGPSADLQGYINLSYNISNLDITASRINKLTFEINFCHTDDITAPITCENPIDGTSNNPAKFDLYNFISSGWSTRNTFDQDDSSSNEQTLNFSITSGITNFVSSNLIYSRFETDIAMDAGEDGSFAIDYANLTVNYTKLDDEGTDEYVNYTSIDGDNHTELEAVDVIITVTYYNGSGSVQAGNKLPDLQVTAYTGSSYTSVGYCSLNESMGNESTTATNCTITITDSTIINEWKNNTASRRVQIRGLYFDDESSEADVINYTNVYIKYFSGSLIANHEKYNLSGYLNMLVQKNNSGSFSDIETIINDTNGGSIRNISADDILDIGSIWNSTPFNTKYYDPGYYRIKSYLSDENGSILSNNDATQIIGYETFILDYLKVNITSPLNNSVQDAEGFDVNATLSYLNYASGGACQYSLDKGSNVTMNNISSTFFSNTTGIISLGTHNITVYCNDTRSIWFPSQTHYFNTTDQRGPNITLIYPPDDSTEEDGNITFQYNVTDIMSGVANCTLIIDYTNRVNTTYNVAENTTINITITGLSNEPHVWQVECYDNSSNQNKGLSSVYEFLVGNDTTPPDITLLDPEPSYNTTTPSITFSYTVVDTQSDIANCSLIINGSVNQTNYSIQTGEAAINYFTEIFDIGSYNWSINCTDIRTNIGASESRIFNVLNDTDYPVIKLIFPPDDHLDTDGDMTFSYNVSDISSDITNCSLIINDAINQTNSSITKDTTQYFTLNNIADGTQLNWSINCTDSSANYNKNSSEIRNLTITIISNMKVTVTTDKQEYQTGEIAEVSTTVKDDLNNNLPANITTDVIEGNATVTWWNTSWARRKPIILSNPSNKTDILVEVNITGLGGNVSNCQNEIRIIKTDSSNDFASVNRSIVSGDNSNYCVVRFRANITGGTNNTDFYAYYNYTVAPGPNNNETRRNLTIQRTADGGSLINGTEGYDEDDGDYNDTTSDNSVYYAVGKSPGGGWGGGSTALEAYINLSYNISGLDIDEENVLLFNFSINFCHTNDVTDPITCSGVPAGDANNPVGSELYNFNDTIWDSIGTFNQNGTSATEQNDTFAYSTDLDKYIENNRLWVRYETDFTLENNEDTSFALDHATINVSYREKIFSNLSSVSNPQRFMARQTDTEISSGLASFNFSTENYSSGAHAAVSRTNMTGYSTTFNHTFFNIIQDTFGPIINLISPPDNNYSINTSINFTYNVTDTAHSVANCSLILNDSIYNTSTNITEGTTQYFYVSNMGDGQYNWSINCTDTLGYENASETRNLTIGGDLFPPLITLYKPDNNTPFLTGSTIIFNYSATDSLNDLANCSLIINGTIFNTTNSPPEGTVLNFTVTNFADGNYTWAINCTDDSSNYNKNSSETRNFSLGPDTYAPVLNLEYPPNGGQTDNGNISFRYNVSDLLSGITNCSISVYNSSLDLVYNSSNSSVQEDTSQYFYAYNLIDGLHYWNITCWDNASTPNKNSSNQWNFTIASDTEPPIVHLISPPDKYQDVDGNVTFFFNVSEEITSIANCSLIFNGSVNTTTNGSEIVNDATNNFTLYNMPNSTYFWSVNCSDTATLGSNIGASPETWNLTVRPDIVGPDITLFNPPDDVQDTDGNVTFEFNASDYASNITNCSLVFNNSINYTWDTVVENVHYNHTIDNIPNANYTWYVNCTDNSTNHNIKQSEIRNLTIGIDKTPPVVTLMSPANNTKNTNGNITFIYNVSDYASNVSACYLIIGGSINQTNTSITEEAPQYFYLYNQNDTQFFWSINCTDDSPSPNNGSSETRNLTVVIPKALATQIITDNNTYILGETVQITANSTNGSGSLVDTNINIDIVRGNAKGPWWDTNWNYRTPILINTSSYSREYYLVEHVINFSDVLVNDLNLTGKTFDNNSIRVVEWKANNDTVEIPSIYKQQTGFNESSNAVVMVSWVIDKVIDANTNKTYHIYFDTNDSSKSSASYSTANYTFIGTGENVNFDGSTNSRNYLIISSGDESFTIQFADGDNLPNQQHIKKQGAGALWNISVNNNQITNLNSSIIPFSIATNYSLTTDDTSIVTSGPITRITIPGEVNGMASSNASLNYTIWFGNNEIFVRANITASFGSSQNNVYAFENTWFSYLFDDDNDTGWTNYANVMNSTSKTQTHNYQGVQENTYNTFYAGDWYIEYKSALGAIGLFVEEFVVNSANATKGIVTFDDDNDGAETDMVGFSDNGNPDITAGDTYELVVWMVFTQNTSSNRITKLKNEIQNPVTKIEGKGQEFITRSSGTTTSGFYYYNFSTSGKTLGNYSAISRANQTDYVNASDYAWFNITADTIPPTVTLVSPQGWLNYNNVSFKYYIAEGGSGIRNCTLMLNGAANETLNGTNITDYANNTFNLTNMLEGSYNWTVLCYDNGSNNGTDSEFNITIDITNPNVTINSPNQGDMLNDSTPLFNFTITDNLGGLSYNYTVYVDGVLNGQNGTAINNTPRLLNLSSLSDGTYNITIVGTDNASNTANDTVEITIDTNAPIVNFETINGTWFNTTTPEIFFNITDSIDSNINYTLYINSSPDQTGNVSNSTSTSETLSAQSDGSYNITIQATDDANNSANYSIIIFIDTQDPFVNLTYPEESANFTTTSVQLNFTVTDNMDSSLTCNLTLDSSIYRNNFEVSNGSESNTTASSLSEATHYWNVTCWDNASNTNTSETRSFNVFIAPVVNLSAPANGNVSGNSSQIFYFNVSDTTGIFNCSLYLNGALNETKNNSEIINDAINNFTVNGLNGTYNWSVKCYDNTTQKMEGNSENWTLIVDLDAPFPNITTSNYTWFNTSTPLIDFIITDNFADPINYTFYVNASANASGSASNNTPSSDNLTGLNSNSSFKIILQATDQVSNSRNSTSIIIYVDTVEPNINLSTPTTGEEINSTSVQFNFTVTDNMAPYTICNLSISNGMNETNINATNATLQNITKSEFASGTYYWNVTCVDLAGNTNTSATWNFTIRAPDLIITSGNITFNDSTPEEGTNITIYANIYNLGGTPADNVTVQFWQGDPDSGGTQINGNKTITTLNSTDNITINITHNASIGYNNIFVVVDPPTATNGSIVEENESNNKDNNSFRVSLYQVYAGNTTELIEMEKQSINLSLFQWNVSNATGNNIFITDIEANPSFTNLQAIGRNTTNDSVSDDFEDIDTALATTNYTDSVNITYTTGGSPKATKNYTIFTSTINYVPIINSTNTTNFQTGILWDTNDGNTQYNGTQDLLFITEINKQKQGSQGIYDYEIKVPALLRNYNAIGGSIAFYAEVK